MRLRQLGFLICFLMGAAAPPPKSPTLPASQKAPPGKGAPPGGVRTSNLPTPRIRPDCPIRLGGVYTQDLGIPASGNEMVSRLSADNQHWIAENCDVAALYASCITPETFPALVKAEPAFTPLLLLYASTIYEQPDYRGNVGGWKPEMAAWTLRDSHGIEVPHPDKGGHWMDFAGEAWAAHWRGRALDQMKQYGAQGVVAAEMPLGNTFVTTELAGYKTPADRADATARWLKAARAPGRLPIVPSAIGFDSLAGHKTLLTPKGTEEPELSGRLWDDYFALMDGAWAEGWIHPYWVDDPLPENIWEIEEEAADRYARSGMVFIAAAAYHNDDELEYDLASYLMATHRQGRFVFQPMPILPNQPADAGFSLAVLRREIAAKSAYFNVNLGAALQERHTVPATGGSVWRRAYQRGVVYVNSDNNRTITVLLGGLLKRLNGDSVHEVMLPPHSGVILLYSKK